MFALLALFTIAHAVEPMAAKADLVSNIVFINWDTEAPVVTLIGGLDVDTGVWSRLYTLDGTRVGNSWHFLVPDERFIATYDEVVVTPTTHHVEAVASIPNAKVTLAVEPTECEMQFSRHINDAKAVGDGFYVNLDHGIRCEGSACDSLRVK